MMNAFLSTVKEKEALSGLMERDLAFRVGSKKNHHSFLLDILALNRWLAPFSIRR